ncbi:Release factor glutamine methyltransferase [Streptomyces sp. YIM 130001]|uniref:HemK2/MTQ2 family protein methyltransferase n=1 Tax=Streptomyces sp. YIM 130001 TaxID=2259644 RepID=UPI000E65BBE8|nr:HemK2/MTQ2 family protein methyltransferase [Streptomyces sp. YIM 130001]RII09707.1 Release factor glutamine methyltransferase [Streptomyces sp. YIM 130001]
MSVREVRAGTGPRLVRLPGVYAPQHDTRLLLKAVEHEGALDGVRLLDLGSGSGALALGAARLGAEVTAVDLAWRAVLATRINARLARQHVRVRRGDLLSAVRGERYEMVVCNPPYVPSMGRPPSKHSRALAWDAGQDGRAVLDRVCATAPEALAPGGVLLLVHSALCEPQRSLTQLRRSGLTAEVTDCERIPLGPVLRSRRDWLEARGLLPTGSLNAAPADEELVVIRARRP